MVETQDQYGSGRIEKSRMTLDKVQATHLLASLVWMMAGGTASMPEFKDRLAPDEQLISLPTRPAVTIRILLRTPSNTPKGTFLFFPGSEGSLVNNKGRPRWGYTRTLPELGFATAIVDMPSDRRLERGLVIDLEPAART